MRAVFDATGVDGCDARARLAGNPWLFARAARGTRAAAAPGEVVVELDWIERAPSSTSARSARARYLRKFYPWYVARLGLPSHAARGLSEALQSEPSLGGASGCLRARAPTERSRPRRFPGGPAHSFDGAYAPAILLRSPPSSACANPRSAGGVFARSTRRYSRPSN